jgi:hypothetical protein
MLIKIKVIAEGPGPSEKLIGVKTSEGDTEQIVVSRRVLRNGHAIEVGLALAAENGNILVELPRESTRGRWRVWVPESEIEEESLHAAE